MHTQRQLLKLAKERYGLTSFTQLADKLGISRSALSQFRLGAPFSPGLAMRIADLTGLDSAYVLACSEYQRASRLEQTEIMPVWARIAEHFAADRLKETRHSGAAHPKRKTSKS